MLAGGSNPVRHSSFMLCPQGLRNYTHHWDFSSARSLTLSASFEVAHSWSTSGAKMLKLRATPWEES
jgi:hypothetical protein